MIKQAFTKDELEQLNIGSKEIENLSRYVLISPKALVMAKWNNHIDNEIKSGKLAANIERNGQVISLQVRELEDGRFEVFDGKKRFKALKDKPFILCYNHGKISDSEAKRIGLETDVHFELDQYVTFKLLKELSLEYDIEDLLCTMPFSEKDINEAINMEYDIDANFFDDANDTLDEGFSQNFGELVASQYPTFAMTFNFDNDKKEAFDEYLSKYTKAELTEAICQYVVDHK